MALTSALVDEARALVTSRAGRRVEGSTRLKTEPGPWFRARLFLGAAPQDVAEGRPRSAITPQLLYGRRDRDGNPVVLLATQQVEVNSRELGHAVWEITGEPEPLRKRRTVIGYQAELVRVEEHEMTL